MTLLITRHNLILSLRGRLIPSSFAGWIQRGSLDQESSGIELGFYFSLQFKKQNKNKAKNAPPRPKKKVAYVFVFT